MTTDRESETLGRAGEMPARHPAGAGVERVVVQLGKITSGLVELMILGLVGIFAYEVIVRYLFSAPTGFADQIGATLLAAITFLALTNTYREGAHVSVDLVIANVRPTLRRKLHVVTELVGLVVSILLTWFSLETVIGSFEMNERFTMGFWTVPLFIPQVVMPIGLGLLSLHIGLSLWVHRGAELPPDPRDQGI